MIHLDVLGIKATDSQGMGSSDSTHWNACPRSVAQHAWMVLTSPYGLGLYNDKCLRTLLNSQMQTQ